jgi:hypothetical protein
VDIGKELVRLQKQVTTLQRSPRLNHASIEDTAILVNDGTGSLRGIIGVQADGTTAVNVVNGPPPPQTSAPIVASVLGGVTVSWDGLFAGGAVIPLDWARVEVHASITPVYDPIAATLQGTIETAQGATVVVPCDTPVYVRLVARNTSGTASTPSDTVGPLGPIAVVADDILDGIVTTAKLADDAVTAAKVATGAIDVDALAAAAVTAAAIAADAVTATAIAAGAVGSTELTAAAVTAAKIAAGAVIAGKLDAASVVAGNIAAAAVQAGNLAANSVQAGNIAANAVQAGTVDANAITAREIAALAVTAGKIAANAVTAGTINAGAVTTASLAAGSVDATALSATAITGKTITGGTVTGALIQTAASGQRITLNESSANKILVYNASGTAIGELSASGLLVKGTNGSVLQLDPNATYPNFKLTNAAGTNAAVINVVGTNAFMGLNSGLFTSGAVTDWKWRTLFGSDGTNEIWVAERVRDSSTSTYLGGRVLLDASHAVIGFGDSSGASPDNYLRLYSGLSQFLSSRLEVFAPASSSSTFYLQADSGQTGNLLRINVGATSDKFTVDKDGNVTAAGDVTSTPIKTTTGLTAGSGFTINTGGFTGYKVGKQVVIDMYLHRSGTTITSSSGNITDTTVATLPAGWRPTSGTINAAWDDGTTSGGWVVGTDGICTLRTSISDIVGDATTAGSGRNLRFHIAFIQD